MTSSSIVARIGIATLCTGGVLALAMCGDDKPMNTVQDMAMSTADMTVPPTPDMAIVQPTVTTLSKTSDFTKGGTALTINGTGFKSGATVKIGTLTAAVTNVTATAITVTIPDNSGKPGKYDVVVTNTDGGTVTLAKGFAYTIETVAFQNVKTYAHTSTVTYGPRAVYPIDLDGKNGPDIVVALNGVGSSFSVYSVNNTDGSLTLKNTPAAITGCTLPFSAAVAEVTGDANVDLVVPCRTTNNAVILKGDGAGNFTLASTLTLPAASLPQAVAVAEVSGDTNVDLVFALSGTTTNNLYRFTGDGKGVFTAVAAAQQPASVIAANAYSVTTADVDKDGKADLIATYTGIATADNVAVILGKSPTTPAKLKSGGINPFWLAVGDFDLTNANLDFVASNNGGNGTVGNFTPFTSDAQATYTVKTAVATTSTMPEGIAQGDFNVDGSLDVVTANNGATTAATSDLTTFLGDGKGGFATGVTRSTGSASMSRPVAVAVADLNNDGRPDIIATNYLAAGGAVVVLINDGK